MTADQMMINAEAKLHSTDKDKRTEHSLKKLCSRDFNPERCRFACGVVIKEHMDIVRDILANADELSTFDVASICEYIRLYEEQSWTKEEIAWEIDHTLERLFEIIKTSSEDFLVHRIMSNSAKAMHFVCSLLGWNDYCLLLSSIQTGLDVKLEKHTDSNGKLVYYVSASEQTEEQQTNGIVEDKADDKAKSNTGADKYSTLLEKVESINKRAKKG